MAVRGSVATPIDQRPQHSHVHYHAMPPYLLPLDSFDLPNLLGADASLYPSPLTLVSLASWIVTAPYLSFKYLPALTSNSPCGICVILPLLERHWEALIRGDLKEWDITPKHLWSPSNPSATKENVGLHVWHIERFESWEPEWSGKGGFGKYWWNDVDNAVKHMLQEGCSGIIGYSGMKYLLTPVYRNNGNPLYSSLCNSRRREVVPRKDSICRGVTALQRTGCGEKFHFRPNNDH